MSDTTNRPDYDPDAILLGVLRLCRKLAGRYAARRNRIDLIDDLVQGLACEVYAKLVAGKYDPARGKATTFAGNVARFYLPRIFDWTAWPVRVPAGVASVSPDCLRPDFREARRRAQSPVPLDGLIRESAESTGRPVWHEVDARDEIDTALARLDHASASLVRSRYGIGCEASGLTQIVRTTGLPEHTVKHRLGRSLNRIREDQS